MAYWWQHEHESRLEVVALDHRRCGMCGDKWPCACVALVDARSRSLPSFISALFFADAYDELLAYQMAVMFPFGMTRQERQEWEQAAANLRARAVRCLALANLVRDSR